MILIGRGLDLAQVLKKRKGSGAKAKQNGSGKEKRDQLKNGQSENHSMCSCQGATKQNKFTISGGNDERVTPVPIPNTEVKPLSADGTWLDTARESRSLPDSNIPQ